MKKIITAASFASLIVLSLLSCKKNSENPLTTLQKIQGTWLLQTVVTNSHYSGTDHISTQAGTATDIFDFRTDGKVYASFSGYKDTSTYSLIGDTQLLIDGVDKYDIKTLSSTIFTIYNKDLYGANYDETTITWTK